MKRQYSALQEAINIAGDQTKLSKVINTSQQNISYWLKSGKVSAEYVVPIEQATGISRHELRPDIYPSEMQMKAA